MMPAKRPAFHFLNFLLFTFLSTISVLLFFFNQGIDTAYTTLYTFCNYCACIYYLLKGTDHGIFSLPSGYLLLLGLFHLGLIVPYQLDLLEDMQIQWLTSPKMGQCLSLCALSFSVFSAAVSFAQTVNSSRERRYFPPRDPVASDRRSTFPLLAGGLGLNLLGLGLLIAGVLSLGIFQYSYGDVYALRMRQDPRLFGTGFMFLLLGAIIAAGGARRQQIRWIILFTLAPAVPLFFFGFRGHLIVYGISIFSIWYRLEPKAAKRTAIVGFLLMMILSPAIRIARNSARMSFFDAVKKVQPLDLFTEAGGSLRPLVETVAALGDPDIDHWWGRSYVQALIRVVPNVNLTWQPNRNGGSQSPGHWISRRVDPQGAARGGGIGFSGIAEPFLNFGLPGVVMFFAILGYSLVRCEKKWSYNPYRFAILMCAYAALLWTTRNDFANFARPAAWSWLFVVFLSLLAGTRTTARLGAYPPKALSESGCEAKYSEPGR